VQSGFSIDENNSGLVVRRASTSRLNDISSCGDVDSSFANRDEIFLKLDYSAAAAGAPVLQCKFI
jgi:hypothetical protein